MKKPTRKPYTGSILAPVQHAMSRKEPPYQPCRSRKKQPSKYMPSVRKVSPNQVTLKEKYNVRIVETLIREAALTAQPMVPNVTPVANVIIGHQSAERRNKSHKDPVVITPLADNANIDPRNVAAAVVTGKGHRHAALPGPDLQAEDHPEPDRHPEMENDTNTKRR